MASTGKRFKTSKDDPSDEYLEYVQGHEETCGQGDQGCGCNALSDILDNIWCTLRSDEVRVCRDMVSEMESIVCRDYT